MTNEEIDNMPAGPELDLLIETEIYGSIPLTDAEWDLCKAMMEHRDPHLPLGSTRMIKLPLAEPTYQMKLSFCLIWPRWFSRESLGDQSRQLVKKMRYDGWLFDLTDYVTTEDKVIRMAGFTKDILRAEAAADTDALAIARAALKAVREWKKSIENTR